jgi:DNA-cytosine methyltransferase
MIKILSLFSGIGAFEKALTNLNIDYQIVNYCEIDRFASRAYCLIHDEDENKNLWEITKINEKELPDFDLVTYGFPCQSFSVAGKRLGLNDPEKGILFFESMRIAKEKKPKYMIAENVKGLLSDDSGQTMQLIISILDQLGYNNYFKVLNAKDYGIPQNRERIFIISIRKDIDNFSFEFPEKIPLKLKLQDIIETGQALNDVSYCLDANYYKGGNLKQFEEKRRRQIVMIDDKFSNNRPAREYTEYSPCLDSMTGGNRQPKVKMEEKENIEIRKLTTREAFRLMGFTDQDHEKLKDISNTQKYKMAGNSIVVDVLEAIFKQLFLSDNRKKWLF